MLHLVHFSNISAGGLQLDSASLPADLRALVAASYSAAVWLGNRQLDAAIRGASGLQWLDCSSSEGVAPSLAYLRAGVAFAAAQQRIAPGAPVLLADEGSGMALLALTCLRSHQEPVDAAFESVRAIAPGWHPSVTERRLAAGYAALDARTPHSAASSLEGSSAVRDPHAYEGKSSGRQNSKALQAGALLGNYRLLDRLGKGAGGSVWRARDERSGALVALKGFTVPHEETSRLEREAEAAKLVLSLHVVRILAVETVPRQEAINTVLVMELIEGQDLQSRLAQRGRFALDETLALLRQIAEGLGAIHAAGIIHRDLKPANVVLTSDGIARIVDFGAAERLLGAASIGRIGDDPYGTPIYMSPEQWAGYAVERSDLYAAGVMLYQMLSGAPPFTGRVAEEVRYAHLYSPPPSLTIVAPGAPPELAELAARLLAKRTAERFPSAAQLVQRLSEIAGYGALRPDERLRRERLILQRSREPAGARTP